MKKWLALGFVAVALCIVSFGCAIRSSTSALEKRPLKEVAAKRWPLLGDDLPADGLLEACDNSLDYLGRVPAERVFRFGSEERTAAQLEDGVRRFQEIIRSETDSVRRTERLKQEFILFRSVGMDGRGGVLFTGYYEPLLDARREQDPPYTIPVFGIPDDLVSVDLRAFGLEPAPRSIVGRADGHKLVPYSDRDEISFEEGLASSAPILGFIEDPVDLFFLQVQGSGTLVYGDGTRLRAGYAVSNGHPYKSIGKLLIDEGLVSRDEMSMQAIRQYLVEHPEEIRRVLSYNKSYVFFRPLDTAEGPLGCYGVPVTAERSVATDRRLFPAPVVAWMEGTMPKVEGGEETFRRFVLNHDTGGAIRGPGRVDVFIGAGDEAGEVAGRMKHMGRFYLLLPR